MENEDMVPELVTGLLICFLSLSLECKHYEEKDYLIYHCVYRT